MKELLLEFLDKILNEAPVPKIADQGNGTVVKTRGGSGLRAKNMKGDVEYFENNEQLAAEKWAKGTQRSREEQPEPQQKKKAVVKKPTSKPTTTKRGKQLKIEPTKTNRKSLELKFGKTKLDVGGLLSAVEGKVSTEGDKGAGTVKSTGGEAATVLGLERLRQLRAKDKNSTPEEFVRKNTLEITTLLSELRGLPKSVLDADWADSAKKQIIATFLQFEKEYGGMDVIAWDNASGRNSLSLGKKVEEDRSDLYIRSKDGLVVGVSLKKDGNVFLANQGMKKVLSSIAEFAPDEKTKRKLLSIAENHDTITQTAYAELLKTTKSKQSTLRKTLTRLTRDDIPDVDSAKYNEFFDARGRLKKNAVELLVSGGVGTATRGATKGQYSELERNLFLRTMSAAAPTNPFITNGLRKIRAADQITTATILKLISDDSSVNTAMSEYLINALDIKQILSTDRPFGNTPVDRFFVVYGQANITDDGNENPMVVTPDIIEKLLEIPKDTPPEELNELLSKKFIVDVDDAKSVGFLRLRVVNKTPPPPYFYPTISTLSVRSRGLLTSPTMELGQHSGWTFALLNGTPDPSKWTEKQRRTHAIDTVEFLSRQLKDPALTKIQKSNIKEEIEQYKSLSGE